MFFVLEVATWRNDQINIETQMNTEICRVILSEPNTESCKVNNISSVWNFVTGHGTNVSNFSSQGKLIILVNFIISYSYMSGYLFQKLFQLLNE